MNYKRIFQIVLVLLLVNPVTVALLSHSILVGCCAAATALVLFFIVDKIGGMRAKVWFFNIIAVISVAYHAELLFKTFSDKNIPNLYELRGKYYFNKPFLDQRFATDEFVSYYRTNLQGYRVDELTNINDSIRQCDWLFIGDSYTQGAQVDYPELFTSLLYRKFPDKIIVNAGISGAGLYDELNYLRDEGVKLHPKRIFLQIGVFNDFMNVKERKATLQDRIMEKSSLYRYITYNIVHKEELPLGRWTEPFFANKEDNIDNNILYKQSSDYKEQDIQNFKDCLSEFKKTADECGAELVLMLLPSKEQVSPDLLQEVMSAFNIKDEELDMTRPNRLCREAAESLKVRLIDLYDVFHDSPEFPFFFKDEHINATGHALIADKIMETFIPEADRYEYQSTENANERYPTISGNSLVYQTQTKDKYLICSKTADGREITVLREGVCELVHPSLSSDGRLLVFTEGDQESHITDVILYDFATYENKKINRDSSSAAIPMLNADGTQVVFCSWRDVDKGTTVNVYDINKKTITFEFSDGHECWRPVFSRDGGSIYYICKETKDGNFIIKNIDIATTKKTIVLKTDYNIWDIALSPSGRYMAYAGFQNGNWDLFLLDISTGSSKKLTDTAGDEWDPCFGADDSELWFAGVFGPNNGIYKMRLTE